MAAAVAARIGWRAAQGPTAGGRTVAQWLSVSADLGQPPPPSVIRDLGPGALPVLEVALTTPGAPTRRAYGEWRAKLTTRWRSWTPALDPIPRAIAAADWLERLGTEAAPEVSTLASLIHSTESRDLRLAAIRALGAVGASAAPAAPELRAQLNGDDEELIAVARKALASIQEADGRRQTDLPPGKSAAPSR